MTPVTRGRVMSSPRCLGSQKRYFFQQNEIHKTDTTTHDSQKNEFHWVPELKCHAFHRKPQVFWVRVLGAQHPEAVEKCQRQNCPWRDEFVLQVVLAKYLYSRIRAISEQNTRSKSLEDKAAKTKSPLQEYPSRNNYSCFGSERGLSGFLVCLRNLK